MFIKIFITIIFALQFLQVEKQKQIHIISLTSCYCYCIYCWHNCLYIVILESEKIKASICSSLKYMQLLTSHLKSKKQKQLKIY